MPISLLNWSLSQFQTLVLILTRVAAVLFMMPILGTRYVPNLVKVGLTLVISLILLPLVQVEVAPALFEPVGFGWFMTAELTIGLDPGLTIKLIFAGIQMAGKFMGYQMGLGMASLLDPQSGVNTTVTAEFNYLVSLLFFLAVDGHHWFFKALVESFREVGPGVLQVRAGLFEYLLQLSGKMFVIAIKLVAPIMAIILFVHMALGLTAKMVPQINLLLASFPLTIGLGLVFLALSIELFAPYYHSLFEEMGRGLVKTVVPLLKR